MSKEQLILTQDNLNAVANILNNRLTFNFQSANITKEIRLDELPPETLAILLDYGTRKLNDKVNSLYKANPEQTRQSLVERVWTEALEGKLGERRTQSNGETGLRNFILSWCRSNGIKAAALVDLKGATPQTIINEIWGERSDEYREKALAEFRRRYEESLKAIELDLPSFAE